MAKEIKRPYWQICMSCDRRVFHVEPQTCDCGEGKAKPMTEAAFHPDNNPGPNKKPEPKPAPAAGP